MTRPITGIADHHGPDGPPDMHQPDSMHNADDDPDVVGDLSDSVTGTEPDSDTDAPRWRWHPIDAAVASFFIAAGYYVTSLLWHSPSSLASTANLNDPTFFEWMLVHAVRIFTHGENPFFTSQLNAPVGVNLMSNTSLLGLTVPFAPLTAWLGPAPVFVLITMLGLAGTAFAWYYVFTRHFVGHRFGAFVGAAFCGFGPGIITHANGHPNITAQFVIPFIVMRALALRNTTRPVRDGIILGLLVTYQAFLNEELLFLTALAGTIFAITYALFRRQEFRKAGTLLTGLAVSGTTTVALLAYPLWFQFKGEQHFSGLPDMLALYPYRLPLNSFVTVPSLSHWGVPWGTPTGFPTGTEQNSFLGWAMVIVVVAIIAVLWRRRPAVRALAVVGVIFAWASLGDVVTVTATSKAHPSLSLWRHLSNLPLFDSVLPTRLALVLVPVVGTLLAFAVADACRAIARSIEVGRPLPQAVVAGLALIVIAAGLVTVVPIPVPPAQRPSIPTFFTSGDWRPYVPAGDSVLSATPYSETEYMRWDIAANLDFNIAGGYFLGPAPLAAGQTTPVGQYGPQWKMTMLVLGSVGSGSWALPTDDSGYVADVVPDLTYWRTAIIVLTANQPYYQQSKDTITRLTGLPGKQVDDVWLWDVRSLHP